MWAEHQRGWAYDCCSTSRGADVARIGSVPLSRNGGLLGAARRLATRPPIPASASAVTSRSIMITVGVRRLRCLPLATAPQPFRRPGSARPDRQPSAQREQRTGERQADRAYRAPQQRGAVRRTAQTCGRRSERVRGHGERCRHADVAAAATQGDRVGAVGRGRRHRVIDGEIPVRVAISRGPRVTAIAASFRGFDTCELPSTSAMNTWWNSSPFYYIGIYIGGATLQVACPDYNVTAGWLTTVHDQGWAFLPIWDGLQDPCSGSSHTFSSDGPTANNQGHNAATNAESAMLDLNFNAGSVIYDDLEGYTTSNSTCVNAAQQFIKGWDQQLSADGWISGVYGSASSSDMDGLFNLTFNPDEALIAKYDGNNTVSGISDVPNSDWVRDHRAKQWQGGHNPTYGGVTLYIDSNCSVGLMDRATFPSEDYNERGANESNGPTEDPACN
jgi:hypothetical protein